MDELARSQQSKLATTPRESFESEAILKAAMAHSKEGRNFELLIEAFHAWILQRRHTTELIQPAISQGRPRKGDDNATFLGDFGFTRSQWSRRKKELLLSEDDIGHYIDICIERSRTPSLYGLLKELSETNSQVGTRCTCGICGNVHLRKA